MSDNDNDSNIERIQFGAFSIALKKRNEIVTAEHFLFSFFEDHPFLCAMQELGIDSKHLKSQLQGYIKKFEKVPIEKDFYPVLSVDLFNIYETIFEHKLGDVAIFLMEIAHLNDSFAANLLKDFSYGVYEKIYYNYYNTKLPKNEIYESLFKTGNFPDNVDDLTLESKELTDYFDPEDGINPLFIDRDSDPFELYNDGIPADELDYSEDSVRMAWRLNPQSKGHKIIGREKELDRAVQILCRKGKNNPIFVGEEGVGKSSMIYALLDRMISGNVPDQLKNCDFYELNTSHILAGIEYKGEFEKRLTNAIDYIIERKGIVYIDDIHNIIGVGYDKDNGLDAGSILKKYLESNKVRIIGTTSNKSYNKYIDKSKGVVRFLQQVEIKEPSEDDTCKILESLIPSYEEFHGVKYEEGLIRYVVDASVSHISDRMLPDKAIDLLDEAGAYMQLRAEEGKQKIVTKAVIDDVLAQVCRVSAKALYSDGGEAFRTLQQRILDRLYGQDEAVQKVVEAVQLAKAGLRDERKPLASLLFVGPTGVGKTELCRVLADELGVELVRFDMSEYSDKYTVSSLIGSTSGYVGYEEGGLLTNAVRSNPNCVLLLDEVEKAHKDIFNILLQVMDYATLTDGRGMKADFHNVIVVMTSNCGAQHAHQSSLGFGQKNSAGSFMLGEVKKQFSPEFINRLTAMIPFNDMDLNMANLVLDRKIKELSQKLAKRNVVLKLSDAARAFIVEKGYSKVYGAREMERALRENLELLLSQELLFGSLKNGGEAFVDLEHNSAKLTIKS